MITHRLHWHTVQFWKMYPLRFHGDLIPFSTRRMVTFHVQTLRKVKALRKDSVWHHKLCLVLRYWHRWTLTSNISFVFVVDLSYPAVAEGQFSHPVHSTLDANWWAVICVTSWATEAIRGEIVVAISEKQICYVCHSSRISAAFLAGLQTSALTAAEKAPQRTTLHNHHCTPIAETNLYGQRSLISNYICCWFWTAVLKCTNSTLLSHSPLQNLSLVFDCSLLCDTEHPSH